MRKIAYRAVRRVSSARFSHGIGHIECAGGTNQPGGDAGTKSRPLVAPGQKSRDRWSRLPKKPRPLVAPGQKSRDRWSRPAKKSRDRWSRPATPIEGIHGTRPHECGHCQTMRDQRSRLCEELPLPVGDQTGRATRGAGMADSSSWWSDAPKTAEAIRIGASTSNFRPSSVT